MSAIVGPGENNTDRLVNEIKVHTGSTMKMETGEGEQLIFLEINSRTLASADDTDTRVYGMNLQQAAYYASQLWTAVQEANRNG